LTYAAHMIDIVNDVILENQPASRLLQLFLNSLYMLSKTDKLPLQIVRIFEIRLLSTIGYAPWVSSCTECGSTLFDSMHFSFLKCGFLCTKCVEKDKGALRISEGAAKALNYIVHSKMNNLFSFEVSENVLEELGKVSQRYMKDRLEKNYNKLDFIKTLSV